MSNVKLVKVRILKAGIFAAGRALEVNGEVDLPESQAKDFAEQSPPWCEILGAGDPVVPATETADALTTLEVDVETALQKLDAEAAEAAALEADRAADAAKDGDGTPDAGTGDSADESAPLAGLKLVELKAIAKAEGVSIGNTRDPEKIAAKIEAARVG